MFTQTPFFPIRLPEIPDTLGGTLPVDADGGMNIVGQAVPLAGVGNDQPSSAPSVAADLALV